MRAYKPESSLTSNIAATDVASCCAVTAPPVTSEAAVVVIFTVVVAGFGHEAPPAAQVGAFVMAAFVTVTVTP